MKTVKHTVDIVIPVYNEEVELKESILKLKTYLDKNLAGFDYQIIIADNASTDKTPAVAQKLVTKYRSVKYFHLDEKGRGRAVKRIWQKSHADIASYMDVDLSTDLNSFPSMLNALTDRGYDIAIGSRLLPLSQVKGRTLKREIMSRCYNILIKLFFMVGFHDAQCGFKAVTRRVVRELVPSIEDNEWFFDSELLIVAEKSGYRIFEEPVIWVDNPGSTVRVMKTATGDLKGLWRLFWTRPWKKTKLLH